MSQSGPQGKAAVFVMLAPILLASMNSSRAQQTAQPFPASVERLHSPLALGVDAFRLLPVGGTFYLMACVENPELEGVTVFRDHSWELVRDPRGNDLHTYPAVVQFRVTASTLAGEKMQVPPQAVRAETDLNSFLLGLRFQLKIDRSLDTTVINPENVRLIGVPSDQPFEERVYRVSFNTGGVPIDARLVLEVFAPNGERLSQFHLDL